MKIKKEKFIKLKKTKNGTKFLRRLIHEEEVVLNKIELDRIENNAKIRIENAQNEIKEAKEKIREVKKLRKII